MMAQGFSQRDPRWAAERLGGPGGRFTLGEAGCLVSAVASLLADWGADVDPGRLNAWLTESCGYVHGGCLVFGAVLPWGARCARVVDCHHWPASMALIAEALRRGHGVVVEVDGRPGGQVQQHWVRLLAVVGADCEIMDPWQAPGAEFTTVLAHYGLPGWNAARAIYRWVEYEPVGQTRGRVVALPVFGVQQALCVRLEAQ